MMRPDPSGPPRHLEWLDHASSDLAIGRLALGRAGVRQEMVCFHAQQAAEKAVKAVLVARQIPFPFTHDLDLLVARLTQSGLPLTGALDDAGRLTPYAVEARYPGAFGAVSRDDAAAALDVAAAIVAWARDAVGSGS